MVGLRLLFIHGLCLLNILYQRRPPQNICVSRGGTNMYCNAFIPQAEAVEFLTWLLHSLHEGLCGGIKKRKVCHPPLTTFTSQIEKTLGCTLSHFLNFQLGKKGLKSIITDTFQVQMVGQYRIVCLCADV